MLLTSRLTIFLTSCFLLGFSGLWSGTVMIARNGVAPPHYLDSYLQESSNITLLRRKHALQHFVQLSHNRNGMGGNVVGVHNKRMAQQQDMRMTMTGGKRITPPTRKTNHAMEHIINESSIHKRAVEALQARYQATIQKKPKNAKPRIIMGANKKMTAAVMEKQRGSSVNKLRTSPKQAVTNSNVRAMQSTPTNKASQEAAVMAVGRNDSSTNVPKETIEAAMNRVANLTKAIPNSKKATENVTTTSTKVTGNISTPQMSVGGKVEARQKATPVQTEQKVPNVDNRSRTLPKMNATKDAARLIQNATTVVEMPRKESVVDTPRNVGTVQKQPPSIRMEQKASAQGKSADKTKKSIHQNTKSNMQSSNQRERKVFRVDNSSKAKEHATGSQQTSTRTKATHNTKTSTRKEKTAENRKAESSSHIDTNSTLHIPAYLLKEPTNHACEGYRGVLLIQSGDMGAAAGTAFFQYVINQIIFAEKYKFLPWVHFNNVSQHVYDPLVHGGTTTTVKANSGMEITWSKVRAPNRTRLEEMIYPHSPHQTSKLKDADFTVSGTGVWTSYFQPVSDFRKGDTSCERLPIITMSYEQLRGMHLNAPWAVRSWQYLGMPPHYFVGENQSLHEWFEPMRRRAHEIVNKYYRFQPYIVQAVDKILPEGETCLGVHIRHSDKWGARRQIPEEEFLPYVKAFIQSGGGKIYLATDDQRVIDTVRTKWPTWVQKRIKTQGDDTVVRSTYQKPVFKIGEHHRTNTEMLNEILALSRCQWIEHGAAA